MQFIWKCLLDYCWFVVGKKEKEVKVLVEFDYVKDKKVFFKGFDLDKFEATENIRGSYNLTKDGITFRKDKNKGKPLLIINKEDSFYVKTNSVNIFDVIRVDDKFVLVLNRGEFFYKGVSIIKELEDEKHKLSRGRTIDYSEYTKVESRHFWDVFVLCLAKEIGDFSFYGTDAKSLQALPYRLELSTYHQGLINAIKSKVLSYFTDFIDLWGLTVDDLLQEVVEEEVESNLLLV